jgi:TolB-like protein
VSEVFVSYKRENLAAVGRLVEALRAEGIGVWWDQDIPPNAAWEATIEKELAAAKLVIVAWSPAAIASDNVKAEARSARGQGRLLQVFVEACDPPLFFGERQGVDLTGWSGSASDATFTRVLDAVREGLEPRSIQASAGPVAPDAPLALPSKPSIAVLPFANLSGDPEQEYFADGMVAEITNALSRFKSIFVIASSSTLTFKGRAVGAQEAARQLGVHYILEGSVRKGGDRVRVTVQLIDAIGGAQMWADRFEDTLDDVFALQDRVALSVAGVIEPALTRAEIHRASRRPTADMDSYDLSLRAVPLMLTFAKADVLSALELLDRSIALDANHGMALAAAAFCHAMISSNSWSDDLAAHHRQVGDLAGRALQHAGEDSTAVCITAEALVIAGESLARGIDLADRARALNPGAAMAWFTGGWMRVLSGQPEAGAEYLETSLRLDPLSVTRPFQLAYLGVARFDQGRFADAVALLEQSMQLSPSYPIGPTVLPACYGHLGLIDAARRMLERRRALTAQTLDQFADWAFHDPAHHKLFLDGIALAEGENLANGSAHV